MTIYYTKKIHSPVGQLTLKATGSHLVAVAWEGDDGVEKTRSNILLETAEEQFEEYFAGQRQEFDLPIKLIGTEFQKRVWSALCKIPYGETASYGEIAKKIGAPKAFRAVGGANNKNPIPIIVPCHRVIGSDGSLTGFGGGMEAKEFLLNLEKEISRPSRRSIGSDLHSHI